MLLDRCVADSARSTSSLPAWLPAWMQRPPSPCNDSSTGAGSSSISGIDYGTRPEASGSTGNEVDDDIRPGVMHANGGLQAGATTAADHVIHEHTRLGAVHATEIRPAKAATAANPEINTLLSAADLPADIHASHMNRTGSHVITADSPGNHVIVLPGSDDVARTDEEQGDPLLVRQTKNDTVQTLQVRPSLTRATIQSDSPTVRL